ncbi:MAG TPA: ribonuclease HII [Negativicutes bacterium]|nr:ribonuclease HII [Negativicutes bacterium]
MKPNFNEEKKLWKQGIECVVGLDEAGRGPLAGPVVAGAVVVNSKFKNQNAKLQFKIQNLKIDDSKKLTEKQREECYESLTNHKDITFGVGVVSEKVIDKINILEATKLAMARALKNLSAASPIGLRPRDFLLLDGNFKVKSKIPQKSIIKGDAKVFSIAAASIIAKVTRDRLMQKMHTKYPHYGFNKHKGYGTALHIKNLEQFGACKIHRKTFRGTKQN